MGVDFRQVVAGILTLTMFVDSAVGVSIDTFEHTHTLSIVYNWYTFLDLLSVVGFVWFALISLEIGRIPNLLFGSLMMCYGILVSRVIFMLEKGKRNKQTMANLAKKKK